MDDSNVSNQELEQGTAANEVVEHVEESTTEAVESKPNWHELVRKTLEKQEGTEPKEAMPNIAAPKTEPAKAIDPITGRELKPIKAPGSWQPGAREHWQALPRSVQEQIDKREREMAVKLQETATERKIANEFKEVVAPYEAMFRQYGTTATAHAKELFNLSHQLNTGSPQVKAQVIHSLISHFQPDIQTLIQLSNGQKPQAQAQQPQPVNVQAEIDKALKAKEDQAFMSQVEQATQAFAADPNNEFFDDVMPMMQKALETGFVKGANVQELFKNAYEFACNNHPEIKQILAQRAAAKVTPVAQPTARPVGSVKPSLGTGKRNAPPVKRGSVQDTVAQVLKNLYPDD